MYRKIRWNTPTSRQNVRGAAAFVERSIFLSGDMRMFLQISQGTFFPLGICQSRRRLFVYPPQRHRTQTFTQLARRPEMNIPKTNGFGPNFLVFERTMRQNGAESSYPFKLYIPDIIQLLDNQIMKHLQSRLQIGWRQSCPLAYLIDQFT